jgi:lipoic acid synthetase
MKARHPEKINNPIHPIKKKPSWIRSKIINSQNYFKTKDIINKKKINNVCKEASCPNISECWSKKHATFMIMGDTCTRACSFCNVKTGKPTFIDPLEPNKIALATKELNLNHVVITSVDRDDLEDGGADHFSKVIKEIKKINYKTTVEVLTPDFLRKGDAYKKVVAASPDVFNHNIETVPSLYRKVRPGSKYNSSIDLLRSVKKISNKIFTKSGIMLGLGEAKKEVLKVMDDLLSANVDFLTIGQYLQPTTKHYPLNRYLHPDEFNELKEIALLKGFLIVASSPLTRSSYHADDDFSEMKKLRENKSQCHQLQ